MTRPADPAPEDIPSLEDLLAGSSPDNLALTMGATLVGVISILAGIASISIKSFILI